MRFQGYDQYNRPVYVDEYGRPIVVTPAVQGGGGSGGGGLGPQLIGALLVVVALLFGLNKCGVIDGAPDVGAKAGAPAGNVSMGQEILKAARRYDNRSYNWGGGHLPNPGKWYEANKDKRWKGLDCSGLVIVSVYDATNGKINHQQVAEGFRNDKHWQKISMRDMRVGDIIWRIPPHDGPIGHVGIVVENNPRAKRVKIFEARSSSLPQPEQIREATYPYSDYDGASRLKFKG